MLFDDALLEEGVVGVGLVVADGEALVAEVADEVVGVGLSGELVDVGAGAVLADEVGVLEGGDEAGGFGDGGDLTREDDGLGGGPGLGFDLAAVLLPSAPGDGSPGEAEVNAAANHQDQEMVA